MIFPARAVFLSYASEDAEAAARVCDALRKAGIEVWFDREDLRGGDAWDLKIKRQIHECALFIPIISTHTNARSEGYFRREWKLATRRLLDIADDAAFLLPVVIDDTVEAIARVPEEFSSVHWTRLPMGEAPPAFAQHVLRLLGRDSDHFSTKHVATTESIEAGGQHLDASIRSRIPHQRWLAATLTGLFLLVLSGGLWWYKRESTEAPVVTPPPASMPRESAALADEKSIAVLPFVDMSADKTQEYMADGIAEELLNLLAQVPDLKVIARTSSFAFKGQNIEIAEIAKRLNVAHVLEGSVRTSGNKLRVTAQLVRTADSTHVWSAKYDRPLSDIFVVQDEIASAIVQALQIKLMGGSPNRHQGGTQNLQAYRLYLQAATGLHENTRESLNEADSYLKEAIELDPEYGDAWSRRAQVVNRQIGGGYVTTQQGNHDFRLYIESALKWSPENAEAHAGRADLYIVEDRNWRAAESELELARAIDPNSPRVLAGMAWISGLFGNTKEAERLVRLAISRDPSDLTWVGALGHVHYIAGQFGDAERVWRSVIHLEPKRRGTRQRLAAALLFQGKTSDAMAVLKDEPLKIARIGFEPIVLQAVGRDAEADAALKKLIGEYADRWPVGVARVYAYRGDIGRTMEWLERAYRQGDTEIIGVVGEPLFNSVVNDARFQAFVRDKLKIDRELGPVG